MKVDRFADLQAGDIVRVRGCAVPCVIIRTPALYGSGVHCTDVKPTNGSRAIYGVMASHITSVVDTAEDEVCRREVT